MTPRTGRLAMVAVALIGFAVEFSSLISVTVHLLQLQLGHFLFNFI